MNLEDFNRRPESMFTMKGKTMSTADWARILGISRSVILNRRRRGKSDEECLKPVKKSISKG